MLSKFFSNSSLILQRIGVILFTTVTILGTAASCSLPGFSPKTASTTTLGILKRDPSIKADGFLRANAVKTLSDDVDKVGLSSISILKMVRIDAKTLFILTSGRGIFKTVDGGQVWQRIYLFPVGSSNEDPKQKDAEITAQLSKNNALGITDLTINPKNPNIIYVSATSSDQYGKIYQSLDGGNTFKEIYTEVDARTEVIMIAANPLDNSKIYGVLSEGAVVRSLDSGITWSKIQVFKDSPVQIGFVPEFGNILYVLLENNGLAISKDGGDTWQFNELFRRPSKIGENQNKDSIKFDLNEKEGFGKYQKIVPVTAGITLDEQTQQVNNPNENQAWILLADRQIWYAGKATDIFEKLILPVQAEQYDILDVVPDPYSGLNKILVSVDDKLFETRNRGQSWSLKELGLTGTVGKIGQILIDTSNPEILFLALKSV